VDGGRELALAEVKTALNQEDADCAVSEETAVPCRATFDDGTQKDFSGGVLGLSPSADPEVGTAAHPLYQKKNATLTRVDCWLKNGSRLYLSGSGRLGAVGALDNASLGIHANSLNVRAAPVGTRVILGKPIQGLHMINGAWELSSERVTGSSSDGIRSTHITGFGGSGAIGFVGGDAVGVRHGLTWGIGGALVRVPTATELTCEDLGTGWVDETAHKAGAKLAALIKGSGTLSTIDADAYTADLVKVPWNLGVNARALWTPIAEALKQNSTLLVPITFGTTRP
jgi:hypothetical protein